MSALRDDAPWRLTVRRILEGHGKPTVLAVLRAEADAVRRETGLRPRALVDAERVAKFNPEMGCGMFLMAAARVEVQAKRSGNLIVALDAQAERLTQLLRSRVGSSRQTVVDSLE